MLKLNLKVFNLIALAVLLGACDKIVTLEVVLDDRFTEYKIPEDVVTDPSELLEQNRLNYHERNYAQNMSLNLRSWKLTQDGDDLEENNISDHSLIKTTVGSAAGNIPGESILFIGRNPKERTLPLIQEYVVINKETTPQRIDQILPLERNAYSSKNEGFFFQSIQFLNDHGDASSVDLRNEKNIDYFQFLALGKPVFIALSQDSQIEELRRIKAPILSSFERWQAWYLKSLFQDKVEKSEITVVEESVIGRTFYLVRQDTVIRMGPKIKLVYSFVIK